MRQIQKNNEPRSLTQWRAAHHNDPNFGYQLIEADLRREIRQALVAEQGGLCAYTGRRINEGSCHIEHPKPQVHCMNGEDVSYSNMLACVPAPNAPGLPYSAHKKGSWPHMMEEALFVSPVQPGCEERFAFTLAGEVKAHDSTDTAATETITRLGLNHKQLQQLRQAAIKATLRQGSLDLHGARTRLNRLTTAEQNRGLLEPFCFVLKQSLQSHIRRVEAIRQSKKAPR